VIVTGHRQIDYDWLVRESLLVVDAPNATRAVTQGRDKIIRLGSPN
jgi:hypothetical protein